MNLLELRCNQIKNLMALCDERNLPVPFTVSDVDEVMSEDKPETEKFRSLGRLASIVHEILYAPPGR